MLGEYHKKSALVDVMGQRLRQIEESYFPQSPSVTTAMQLRKARG